MKNQIVTLPKADFISVAGPDAAKFLQGQLSCNTDLLSTTRSLRGAMCNLKGRVIADMRLVHTAEGCLLRTEAGMAETVLKTLSKYAVFSKVKLTQAEGIAAFGVLGSEAADQIAPLFPQLPQSIDAAAEANNAWIIREPGEAIRYEIWIQGEEAVTALKDRAASLLTNDATHWQREALRAGLIHVDAAITEEYTPQLLNYDISGVIDFKKGCYTGQEIVARMFYRSVAKKRLCLLSSDTAVVPGESVHWMSATGSKDFPILAWSNSPDGSAEPHLLLAVMDIDAAPEHEQLKLTHSPEAELWQLPLHY